MSIGESLQHLAQQQTSSPRPPRLPFGLRHRTRILSRYSSEFSPFPLSSGRCRDRMVKRRRLVQQKELVARGRCSQT